MKRITAIFLTIMLLAAMMPFSVWADGDKGLEDAIKAVKEKITIPEKLTQFNYNINMNGDKKVWNLDWSSKNDSGAEGSIHISIDDKGTIMSYSYYKPSFDIQKKLPRVSKQEAKSAADDFISIINPSVLPQIKYMENSQTAFMNTTYNFRYSRYINGIPYNNNWLSIDVNRETGEVQSYYCNWTDGIVFPAADNIIDMEKAQKAYTEKLGLKLTYNYAMDGDKTRIFAAYTPKYNTSTYIDAITGEKTDISNGYTGPYYDKAMDQKLSLAKNAAGGSAEPVSLSPEEMKAVEAVSKLISQEDAEKQARACKLLELSDDFKLTSANLVRDWPNKDGFLWYLNFRKDSGEKTKFVLFTNVTIDASTGEIKRFYLNQDLNGKEEPKYDEAASKAAVDKFLKEFKPEKLNDVEYDKSSGGNIIYAGKTPQTQYYFTYVRKVNGVAFPGNSISVTFDAVNGKIVNFNMSWFDANFPSVDKVIPVENAYKQFFDSIGLELQYVPVYKNDTDNKILPPTGNTNAKPEMKLVYAVKSGKPLLLDAFTGGVINYDGQPYKEVKPAEYTDIEGNYAEKQIRVLVEYGISLEGSEFKPDESITQKDFLKLLSKTLPNYYIPYAVSVNSDKETEQLYSYLIREGIIKAGEKAPDAAVTREDSVKYIVRALKYDKVADIKGIFNLDFKDIDLINPDLVGYVAIAHGLKIINGYEGCFNPGGQLSRADAAIIIYNYLQR